MAISTFEFSFPRSFLVKAYQKRFSPNVIEYSASYITSEYEWKRCALTTINPDRLSKQNQLHCQLQIPYESDAHSKEGKIGIQLRNLSVDIVNSEIHLNLHDLSDTPYRDDDVSLKQTPTIDELNFALPFSCIEKIVRNRGGTIYRSEAWYLGLSGVVLPCMLNATEMLTDNGEERLQLVFEGLILSNSISPLNLKFMAASANRPKQPPSSAVSTPVIVSTSMPTVPCSTNTLQQVHPITITVPPPTIGFNLTTNPMIPTIPMMPAMQAFSLSQVIPTQNNPHITVTAGSILQVTTSGPVINSTITSTTSAGPTETHSDESYRSLVHIEEIIAKDFSPKDDSDLCEPMNLTKNREESPDLLGKIIEETILKDTDSDNSLDRILAGNPTFSERDIIKTGNDVETAVMQSMASEGSALMVAPRVEISQGSHYVNSGGIVSEAFIMANSMVDSDDELLVTQRVSKTETKSKSARRNTTSPRSKNPKKQSGKSTKHVEKDGKDSSVKGKEKHNPVGSYQYNDGIELISECGKEKYSYSEELREKTFIQSIENDNTLSMANSSTLNTKPKTDMGKLKAKSIPKFRKIRPSSPFIEIPSEASFVGVGESVKQNKQEESKHFELTAIGRLKAKSSLKSMVIRSDSPVIEIPSEASFVGIGESDKSTRQEEKEKNQESECGTISDEIAQTHLRSESNERRNPTDVVKQDKQHVTTEDQIWLQSKLEEKRKSKSKAKKDRSSSPRTEKKSKDNLSVIGKEEEELRKEDMRSGSERGSAVEITELENQEAHQPKESDRKPTAPKESHEHKLANNEKLKSKSKKSKPTKQTNDASLAEKPPQDLSISAEVNEEAIDEVKSDQEVNGIGDEKSSYPNKDEVIRSDEDRIEEDEEISKDVGNTYKPKHQGRKKKFDMMNSSGRCKADTEMVMEGKSRKGAKEKLKEDVEKKEEQVPTSDTSLENPRGRKAKITSEQSKNFKSPRSHRSGNPTKEADPSVSDVARNETSSFRNDDTKNRKSPIEDADTSEPMDAEPSQGTFEAKDAKFAVRDFDNSDSPSKGRVRGRKRKGAKGEEESEKKVASDKENSTHKIDAHEKESENEEDVVEDVDKIDIPKAEAIENSYKDLKVVIEFMDTEKFQPLQERVSKKAGGLKLKISRVKKQLVASKADDHEEAVSLSSDDEPLAVKKNRTSTNKGEENEISRESKEDGTNPDVKSSTEDIADQTIESGILNSITVEDENPPPTESKGRPSKSKDWQARTSQDTVPKENDEDGNTELGKKQGEHVAVIEEKNPSPIKRKGRPPKSKNSTAKTAQDTIAVEEEVNKESSKEQAEDVADQKDNNPTPKRKGRPPKSKSSQDKNKEEEEPRETAKNQDENVEKDENPTPTKRKGRPSKSKNSTAAVEGETNKESGKKQDEDVPGQEERNPTPTKRGGRPPKSISSQDKNKEEKETRETGKNQDENVVEGHENPTPTKRKGRPPKSISSQDKNKEEGETGKNQDENVEEDENSTPTKLKGRPQKSKDRQNEISEDRKEEENTGSVKEQNEDVPFDENENPTPKSKEVSKDKKDETGETGKEQREDVAIEEAEIQTPTKRKGRPPKSKTPSKTVSKDVKVQDNESSKKQDGDADIEKDRNPASTKHEGISTKTKDTQAKTVSKEDEVEDSEFGKNQDGDDKEAKRRGRPQKAKDRKTKISQNEVSNDSKGRENTKSGKKQDGEDGEDEEGEHQTPTKRRGRPPKSKKQSTSIDTEDISLDAPEDNNDGLSNVTNEQDKVTSDNTETKNTEDETMKILDPESGLLKTVSKGDDTEPNKKKNEVSNQRGRKPKKGRGNRFQAKEKESADNKSDKKQQDQAVDPESGPSLAVPEVNEKDEQNKNKDVQEDQNVPIKNQKASERAEEAPPKMSTKNGKDSHGDADKAPEDDFDLNNIVESIKKSLSERKSPAKDITSTAKISGTWTALGKKGPAVDMTPLTSSVGSFEPEWRAMFPWIYYEEENKAIFCKVCTMGEKKNVYTSGSHFLSLEPLLSHTESDDHVTAVTSHRGPTLLLADDAPEWQDKLQQCLSQMSTGHRLNRFNFDWLNKYKWLVYDEDQGKMFCKYCQKLDVSNMFKQGTKNFVKKHLLAHSRNKIHQEAIVAQTAPANKTSNTDDEIQLDTSDIFFSVETDETVEAEPLRWNRIADSVNHSGSDTDSSFTPKVKRVPTYMSPVIQLQDVSESPFLKSGRVDVKSVPNGIETLVPRKPSQPSLKSSEKQKKKAMSFQSEFEMNIAKLSVPVDVVAERNGKKSSTAESESSLDSSCLVSYLDDDKTAAKPGKSSKKLGDKDIDSDDILAMIPLVLEDSMNNGPSSRELSPKPSTSQGPKDNSSSWIPEPDVNTSQTSESLRPSEELLAEYLANPRRELLSKSREKSNISAWKPVVVLSAIVKEDHKKTVSTEKKETSSKRKSEDVLEVSEEESAITRSAKVQKDPAWISIQTAKPEVLPMKPKTGKKQGTGDDILTFSSSLGYSSDDSDDFDLPDIGGGDSDVEETKGPQKGSGETAADAAINNQDKENEDEESVQKLETKKRGRPSRKSKANSLLDNQSVTNDEEQVSTPGKTEASFAKPSVDVKRVEKTENETKKRGRPSKKSKSCSDAHSDDKEEETTSEIPESSDELSHDVQNVEKTDAVADTKKRGRPSKKSKSRSTPEKDHVETNDLPKNDNKEDETTSEIPESSDEASKDVQSVEQTDAVAETEKRGRKSKKSKSRSTPEKAHVETNDLLKNDNKEDETTSEIPESSDEASKDVQSVEQTDAVAETEKRGRKSKKSKSRSTPEKAHVETNDLLKNDNKEDETTSELPESSDEAPKDVQSVEQTDAVAETKKRGRKSKKSKSRSTLEKAHVETNDLLKNDDKEQETTSELPESSDEPPQNIQSVEESDADADTKKRGRQSKKSKSRSTLEKAHVETNDLLKNDDKEEETTSELPESSDEPPQNIQSVEESDADAETKKRGRKSKKSKSRSTLEKAHVETNDLLKNDDKEEETTSELPESSDEAPKDVQSVEQTDAVADTKKRGRKSKKSKSRSTPEKAHVETNDLPKNDNKEDETTSEIPESSDEPPQNIQSVEESDADADTKKRGRQSKKSKPKSRSHDVPKSSPDTDLPKNNDKEEESTSEKHETSDEPQKDVSVTDSNAGNEGVEASKQVTPDKSAQDSSQRSNVARKKRGRQSKHQESESAQEEVEAKRSRRNSSSPRCTQRRNIADVDEDDKAESKTDSVRSRTDDNENTKSDKKSTSGIKPQEENLQPSKDSDNVEYQNKLEESKAPEKSFSEETKEPEMDKETGTKTKPFAKGKKRKGRPPKNVKSTSLLPNNDEETTASTPKKLRKKSPSPVRNNSADDSDGGCDFMDLPDDDGDDDDGDFASLSKPDDKMDVGTVEATDLFDIACKVTETKPTAKTSEESAVGNQELEMEVPTTSAGSAKDTEKESPDKDVSRKVGRKPKGKKGRGRPFKNAKTVSVVPSESDSISGLRSGDKNTSEEHNTFERHTDSEEQPESKSFEDSIESPKHISGSKSDDRGVNEPDFETVDISEIATSEQTLEKCKSKTQEKSIKKKSPKIGPKCSKRAQMRGETVEHEPEDIQCRAVGSVRQTSPKVRLGPKSVKERLLREELGNIETVVPENSETIPSDSESPPKERDLDDLLNNLDLTEMMMCYISLKPLKSQ